MMNAIADDTAVVELYREIFFESFAFTYWFSFLVSIS